MAPSGTGRKTAPSNASPSTEKASNPTVKLKKSTSKIGSPSVASSVRSDSPGTNAEDASADKKATTAAAAAAADERTTKRCTHCGQHMPLEGFDAHSKQCLRDKKERKRKEKEEKEAAERAAAGEGDSILSAANEDTPLASLSKASKENGKKGSVSAASGNNKKRKADTESTAGDTKPPTKKQKKKEEAANNKAKTGGTKPARPVDVEKQCGVLLPNGLMCARSLTCKSHAMGAKRSVPGRSLPYDVLLAQYQKKNQAKLQKAAMASNQPLPDDLSLDGPAGPIDSDEERDAVMAGVTRAAPKPLFSHPAVSMKSKYSHIRMKEMLASAMGGNRGGGLFSTAGWAGHNTNAGTANTNGTTATNGMDGVNGAGSAMKRVSTTVS